MPSPRKILRSQENLSETAISTPRKAPSSQNVASMAQPKAPRSAFMCFTEAKKKEIMSRYGMDEENDDILKAVAREWRALSDRDRGYWDEEARNDKVRFVREKAAYKGPWAIPKRRAKKHPLAPKRPMSAFLKYSQTRRAMVKRDNPDMSNTDVSRLLGEMWRNASQKERAPYVDQEERERAIYKAEIKKFKDGQAIVDAASRTSHQSVQKMMADCPPHHGFDHGHRGSPSMYDTMGVDSFDEAPSKASLHQAYTSSFAPYRQPYSSRAAPQLHPGEYHDSEPLAVARAPIPHMHMHDDGHTGGHYGSGRSNYFPDNMTMGYSRYP